MLDKKNKVKQREYLIFTGGIGDEQTVSSSEANAERCTDLKVWFCCHLVAESFTTSSTPAYKVTLNVISSGITPQNSTKTGFAAQSASSNLTTMQHLFY